MSSDLKTQFLNYMTVQRFSHHTCRLSIYNQKYPARIFRMN